MPKTTRPPDGDKEMTDQPFSALSTLVGKITPTWQAIVPMLDALEAA